MDIFTFTPGGIESIDAFNGRLAAYAANNNVTGARTSILGNTLVLSLTLDQDIPAPLLLRPFVGLIGADGLPGLETALTNVLDAIKAEDNPEKEVMSVPVECRCFAAVHEPTQQVGYAVFLIAVGEIDDE